MPEQLRILVTGAGGQLGQTFQKYQENYPEFQFYFKSAKELDISDKEQLEAAFKIIQPHYCINCAAYTQVDKAEEEEKDRAFLINAEAVKHLAELAKANYCVLVQISTDYVFDGEKNAPYTITDTPNPINVYGQSKLKGEQYIQEILKHYFIIRTSWLYSKEFGKNFYRTILQKAKENKQLKVVNSQIGCPTETDTLVTYILELIRSKSNQYGLHHCVDVPTMSWYEFAKRIVENNHIQGVEVIPVAYYPTLAKRPKYSVLK